MATPAIITNDNLPTIALVGRVNVGKSTLFNRLIEQNKAMVSDIPGTTRTNNEGVVIWRGKYIRLIDTGGLTFNDETLFEDDIRAQAERAIASADVILFLVDVHVGLLPQELLLAKLLRGKTDAPILLVGNKVDNTKAEAAARDIAWQRLGLGAPFLVSGVSGRSTGDLLDAIFALLNKGKVRPKQADETINPGIRVSLIGKPNVGKSSLFNKLIGEDKVIVSDMAHTTREPHDTLVTYDDGQNGPTRITFVDTAGIRRKSNVEGDLEGQGVMKSIAMIEESDIVLFVLDGSDTISSQDMQLGGLLERRSKSVIILLNKWDMAPEKSDEKRNEAKKMITKYFPHLSFAPIMLVSGKTGYRVHDVFPEIMHAWKARHTQISQHDLDAFFEIVKRKHRPVRGKGTRMPSILGFRQIRTNPPMFELFIKVKTSLNISYVHYIENTLREHFDFFAVPIVIKLTKMKK